MKTIKDKISFDEISFIIFSIDNQNIKMPTNYIKVEQTEMHFTL